MASLVRVASWPQCRGLLPGTACSHSLWRPSQPRGLGARLSPINFLHEEADTAAQLEGKAWSHPRARLSQAGGSPGPTRQEGRSAVVTNTCPVYTHQPCNASDSGCCVTHFSEPSTDRRCPFPRVLRLVSEGGGGPFPRPCCCGLAALGKGLLPTRQDCVQHCCPCPGPEERAALSRGLAQGGSQALWADPLQPLGTVGCQSSV